jgi:hypothetical protein
MFCFSVLVPELYPRCTHSMEQGKATRSPVHEGVVIEFIASST